MCIISVVHRYSTWSKANLLCLYCLFKVSYLWRHLRFYCLLRLLSSPFKISPSNLVKASCFSSKPMTNCNYEFSKYFLGYFCFCKSTQLFFSKEYSFVCLSIWKCLPLVYSDSFKFDCETSNCLCKSRSNPFLEPTSTKQRE